MKIDLVAGITPCPFQYTYDGSLGDEPFARIELKRSDGSYTYDYSVRISHDASGSLYTITGEPDDNGKFLFDYRFILDPQGSLSTGPGPATTFPLSLPYTFQ